MLVSTFTWFKTIPNALLLIPFLIFKSGFDSAHQYAGVTTILIDCFLWLWIGALSDLISSKGENLSKTILGILIGWGILWSAWYLPALAPIPNSNDYGLTFDLQKSPVELWLAVAFILGFYRKLPFKFPFVIKGGITRLFGVWEAKDQKGNAKHRFMSFWNALIKNHW